MVLISGLCGAEHLVFWRSCGAFCDLTQDLIGFLNLGFTKRCKNIIIESVGILNVREFRSSNTTFRLGNGGSYRYGTRYFPFISGATNG